MEKDNGERKMKSYSISFNGQELVCVRANNEEDAFEKAGIEIQEVDDEWILKLSLENGNNKAGDYEIW